MPDAFGIQKCGECRYGKPQNVLQKNGLIDCWRYPPQIILVPIQGPGGSMGISAQAVRPSSKPDEGCGDGLPREGAISMPVRFDLPQAANVESVNGGDA